MLSNRNFNRILVLLLVVSAISKCNGIIKQICYEVDSLNICYFQPSETLKNETWENASKICKNNNSTLPKIENERIQEEFVQYMINHTSLSDVWIAGREYNTETWLWLNGKPISNQSRVNGTMNKHFAVLTMNFDDSNLYSSANNSENHSYICEFHDNTSCQSKVNNIVIPLESCCFVVNVRTRLGFNRARRKCLDYGGDLATFEDDEDLMVSQRSHKMQLNGSGTYWIGLSQFLWLWNITELTNYTGFTLRHRCRFLKSNSSKWHQDQCYEMKGIICQTGLDFMAVASTLPHPGREETSTENEGISTGESDLFYAIIIGAIVGLVIIVTLIAIFKILRRKKDSDANARLTDHRPDGKETHRDECKYTEETTEMNGLYAEVQRKVQCEDHGSNTKEPQSNVLYATLEFAK